MLLPAITGTGLAMLVSDKSAEPATTTLVAALLLPELGSPVTDDPTESVCVMVVPGAVPEFTVTIKVKFAVVLAASVVMVQVSVPTVQVQPAGPVRDWAVVFAGSVSVKVTVLAAAGPPLLTVWV